jgi:RHS repeat-associated protein
VEYQYDSYNNETIRQEFGYGNGTPGTLERLTETQYLGGTYPTDANVHLRRLPTNVKVYGYPGSTQTLQSETTVGYDETGTYPIQECASIPGHDTVYSTFLSGNPSASTYRTHTPTERGTTYAPRGLATTVYQRVDGGSTWITTKAQYDLAGNLVKSWDGRSHPTTLSYQTGNCSFLTSVTTKSVTPTGTDHTVLMQYDANTGKVTQHTDPSSVVTALSYEADLGRLIQVKSGSGTTAEKISGMSYNDSAQTVTVTAPVFDAFSSTTITKYDGLGRLIETEQATGGNPIISRIKYDALGRVLQRSLPSDNGAYQYTTFTYDALDRVFKATNADSSISRTCYKGDQVIARDEAGKWRLSQMDALGRLVSVTEDPSGATCDGQSSANPGLAYVTNYAYNAVDNLLSVSHMVGSSAGQTRSFSYDMAGRLLTANNPETGTITYSQYDGNGNLGRKTDARGWQTNYAYDKLNRPTSKTYSDGNTKSVTWVWDTQKIGRLTSVESDISRTSFTYDAVARIASSTQRTDGVDYPFQYRYHKGWGLKQVQYPSQRWVRYTPDVADRIDKVERLDSAEQLDKTYWWDVQYAPHGAPQRIQLGSAPHLYQHIAYNVRLQPTQIGLGSGSVAGTAAASDRMGLAFDYGSTTNNGNVLTQVVSVPGATFAQTYGYDPVNRLCSVRERASGTPLGPYSCTGTGPLETGAGETWRQRFGYDQFGNQWVAQHLGTGMPYSGLRPTTQSNYDASTNRRMAVANAIAFNGAGEQTRLGEWNLAYDGEGRVRESTKTSPSETITQVYDGEGRRVKRTVGAVSTWFVYDASGELVAEYGGTTPAASATHYVTTDHLGSTRVVTDQSGAVVSRHDFLPFGEEIGAGIGGRTTGMMYVANNTLMQRFTGKERDAETGLDYFGARYLSAAMGRFTSPDLPLLSSPDNPQTWNLYSYTANNPLSRTDPDGRNWFQVGGNWEWHEGDTYDPDGAKGKQKPIKSNYTHLLVFQQTGTNRYGAATGTLTLYDQNKVIATSTGFSGGPSSPAKSEPIPGGTFYINLARKETATSPGAVRVVDGGAQLHNHYGIEKIPPTLSDAAGNAYDFRVEWGNIRAALNEPRPGMPQAYRGNFLHGKTRAGDYTHGCICERSERILNTLWTLPTPRVPVWVRRP